MKNQTRQKELKKEKQSKLLNKIKMVKVNREKCIGCGMCQALCPEVFELEDGKAKVKNNVDVKKYKDCIKEAKESCPMQAIEE
jgi:ferredoxin